jgi:hypothetical protein
MAEIPKATIAQLAAILAISERRVSQLAGQGVLKRDPDGYDLSVNVPAYLRFRERAAMAKVGAGTYGQARAALYLERARTAKLKREELERQLLPSDEVIAAGIAVMARVRNRILAIASKVAPRLINLRNASEAEAIVHCEHIEALEELARLEVVPQPSALRRGG